MSKFLGWEEPPEITTPTGSWNQRLHTLAKRPGQWARFGPYPDEANVRGVATTVRGVAERADLTIETEPAERDGGNLWDLYVRVVKETA